MEGHWKWHWCHDGVEWQCVGRVVEKKKIEAEKNEASHEWELGGKKKKKNWGKEMGSRPCV